MATTEADAQASPYISQEEAGELLGGMNRASLANLRYAGTGPAYYKVGRRILYRRDEVLKWIESTRRTSTAQAS